MLAAPAMAATFTFHGDLNNRFLLYTDQAGFFDTGSPELDDQDRPDSYGEIKYRLWTTAETDDGAAKGVFAIEVGAIKFGDSSRGGAFSGDGVNIETRWFYTDFQIPSVESKARVQIGLLPHKVNRFFWKETAMGVKFYGDNYSLAWIRGRNTLSNNAAAADWGDNDLDSINARYDLKMEPAKVGFFASYLWQDITTGSTSSLPTFPSRFEIKVGPLSSAAFDLLAIGVDGSWSTATSFGKAFVNWDLIYETGGVDDVGSVGNDFDISAYLLHGDFGLTFGKTTVTYTVWYASGDDNSSDKDIDNFMSVDVDFFESFIFQESLTDDNVFFEGPYVSDKGLFFNKLALHYAASKKLKLGIAGIYHLLAEDATLATGAKDDELGFEINAYGKYKLYGNLELALHLGYLTSGDAMDVFETGTSSDVDNGKGDIDIFKSEARVRYGF
jgi:hypothetical protein